MTTCSILRKRFLACFSAFLLVGLGSSLSEGVAQTVDLNSFAPPDKAFTIDLPWVPIKTAKFNPGKKDETTYFRCTKALEAAYKFSENEEPFRMFQIGIFNVSKCKRKPSELLKESKTLVTIYTTDDPGEKILHQEEGKVDGYPSRMFVSVNSAGVHVWDLFVETEERIYWIYISTEERGTERSSLASRILTSFRVAK